MSRLVALFRSWLAWLGRNKMFLVMLGGAVGAGSRYAVSRWFDTQLWAQGFPYGTLFINVTGSFILAMTTMIVTSRLPAGNEHWGFLIGTGFCGGYTTFSTFEWETFKLVRNNQFVYALLNVFGSCAAGFVGILAGVWLVHLLIPRR